MQDWINNIPSKPGLFGAKKEECSEHNKRKDSADFDMSDLESLQDANIDEHLLETGLLHHSHSKAVQEQLLDKHSKMFGIALIPRKDILQQRRTYFAGKKS
jgi:hypothetical protein